MTHYHLAAPRAAPPPGPAHRMFTNLTGVTVLYCFTSVRECITKRAEEMRVAILAFRSLIEIDVTFRYGGGRAVGTSARTPGARGRLPADKLF